MCGELCDERGVEACTFVDHDGTIATRPIIGGDEIRGVQV